MASVRRRWPALVRRPAPTFAPCASADRPPGGKSSAARTLSLPPRVVPASHACHRGMHQQREFERYGSRRPNSRRAAFAAVRLRRPRESLRPISGFTCRRAPNGRRTRAGQRRRSSCAPKPHASRDAQEYRPQPRTRTAVADRALCHGSRRGTEALYIRRHIGDGPDDDDRPPRDGPWRAWHEPSDGSALSGYARVSRVSTGPPVARHRRRHVPEALVGLRPAWLPLVHAPALARIHPDPSFGGGFRDRLRA